MDQHLPLQEPPKITQIVIFGLIINHLATLSSIRASSSALNCVLGVNVACD
jgi:hypothetical protein